MAASSALDDSDFSMPSLPFHPSQGNGSRKSDGQHNDEILVFINPLNALVGCIDKRILFLGSSFLLCFLVCFFFAIFPLFIGPKTIRIAAVYAARGYLKVWSLGIKEKR